jgi:hypothetical protein
MIHENLHVGQKTPCAIAYDFKVKSTATTNGNATVTDTQTTDNWKLTLTTLAEKDGSSTQTRAEVDPASFDTTKIAGADAKKTPCPFAGKSIVLTRGTDESFSNDFPGTASDDDTNILNSFLTPDEDLFPDKPVTVGQTWDNSDKMSKHTSLGARDQLLSKCRLDWVKTIDGKQMAQISSSVGIIYHEQGNVEEDVQYAATLLVDVAAGMIVKCDQKGSSTYSTPPTEATQVSGGTEFTFHCEVLPATPTTKP